MLEGFTPGPEENVDAMDVGSSPRLYPKQTGASHLGRSQPCSTGLGGGFRAGLKSISSS